MRAHAELHEEASNGVTPSVLAHALVPSGDADLIEDQSELCELIAQVRARGSFAFDTEFIGERTYFTRTCLVQVGTPDRVALVDPLRGLDLSGVWALLSDPGVEKVVHAGVPDLELALRHTGAPARHVFDTQIGAGFCGMAYPASLRAVAESVCGAHLSPGLKFSQWDRRPLTGQQLRYAADDVRYLLLVRDGLIERLRAMGNLEWAREEFARLERAEEYESNPHTRRLKTEGAGQLTPRQRHVLRRLIEWREGEARARDLSPRTLIPDEGLVSIAREGPKDLSSLRRARGVPRGIAPELGEGVLGAMSRAACETMARPPKRRSLSERQKRDVEGVCERAEALARERGIALSIVGAKREIRQLAGASILGEEAGDSRLLVGWRRALLAPLLGELGFA